MTGKRGWNPELDRKCSPVIAEGLLSVPSDLVITVPRFSNHI